MFLQPGLRVTGSKKRIKDQTGQDRSKLHHKTTALSLSRQRWCSLNKPLGGPSVLSLFLLVFFTPFSLSLSIFLLLTSSHSFDVNLPFFLSSPSFLFFLFLLFVFFALSNLVFPPSSSLVTIYYTTEYPPPPRNSSPPDFNLPLSSNLDFIIASLIPTPPPLTL